MSSLYKYLPDTDIHISGLRIVSELDMRVSDENLGKDKLKVAGCLAIALL
jgi:hypothetical protein